MHDIFCLMMLIVCLKKEFSNLFYKFTNIISKKITFSVKFNFLKKIPFSNGEFVLMVALQVIADNSGP